MFLKSLKIENSAGVIRLIKFHEGLNLIVDETPDGKAGATGNNVGKTTVLMLIDFCLGANPKSVYTDPETKKEYALVKEFLVETKVLVTLTLVSDLKDVLAEELVIERNFLQRNKHVRRINDVPMTEDAFEEYLTNQLFPGHYGKKPTFGQIISHNIRYKDSSVNNTLKTLDKYTRDDEYETLYLFLLGCEFDSGDTKQNLLTKIRTETTFKARLEATQTRSAYEVSLALLEAEIERLNQQRTRFNTNPEYESDLRARDSLRYEISFLGSKISRLSLKINLIKEAVQEINSGAVDIDARELKELYSEVSKSLGPLHRSFGELLDFHNKMIKEKVRYIQKELPDIEGQLAEHERHLKSLLISERALVAKLATSESISNLEQIITSLNENHRKKGEYEAIIGQIAISEKSLAKLEGELKEIDEVLFSEDFGNKVQEKVNKFNEFFSRVSKELYGEEYALKFDRVTTKTGQRIYKFSAFNTNFSSGKKQGEITCFDIAYTLFADDQRIPCYHFLLNDKKELMHDNQLVKIAEMVNRERKSVQFVASILRDKLPKEINRESYFVVRLSQSEKLFKIEGENNRSLQ